MALRWTRSARPCWTDDLDPGRRAGVRRRGQGPLGGSSSTRRFAPDGWRFAHVVRGAVVPTAGRHRRVRGDATGATCATDPASSRSSSTTCGNVYDDEVANVHDDDYDQPHTAMNHYQDIAVRRVIAELVDDPGLARRHATRPPSSPTSSTWGPARRTGCRGPAASAATTCSRSANRSRRATCLSPAVVPVHDPR